MAIGEAPEPASTNAERFGEFLNPDDRNPAGFNLVEPFGPWTDSLLLKQRFDWREEGLHFAARAQGAANCCTSYAIAAMAEARWQLRYGQSIRVAGAYIHNCLLGVTDPLQGVNPETAARAAVQSGLGKATTDGPPLSAAQCEQIGAQRIGVVRYGWIAPGAGMLNALVTHGPLLLEMDVPPDFPNLRTHDLYGGAVDGATAKRHCMVLVGYDYPARRGILLNSMGRGWGNDGFLTVRFGVGGVLDYYHGIQIDIAG